MASLFLDAKLPRKVLVLDEELTTENDMLTPTMKVKWRKVAERYRAQIDALYREGPPEQS